MIQKPVQDRKLSINEEKSLDSQIQEAQDTMDGAEITQGVNRVPTDKKKLQEKLSYLRRVKETRGVRRVEGRERQAVEAEERSLRERLRKGMPNWNTYIGTRKRDGVAYIKLKRWIIQAEQDPQRRVDIQRWKTLRRMLEPTDSSFSSTMYLFEGSQGGY